MRFLFVISELGPNGPTASRIRYAGALAARGHDVTLLALVKGEQREMPEGVTFRVLDPSRDRSARTAFQQMRSALLLRVWFRKATQKAPFDFVSSSLTSTDRVVARSGLKNVYYWIHIATTELVGAVSGKRKRERRAMTLRKIYRDKPVIGVSQGVLDDLSRFKAIPSRAELIYNAYDVAQVQALARQTPTDLPNTRFLIHVGRFADAKRHDLLFQAFARSGSSAQLLLLTDKPEEAKKLAELHRIAERVIALGFRDNPYAYMKAADALILSSDYEGFPNVLVESLIAGTPVISTDCPYGPAEILIGDYAQWLSPVGDVDRLATLIQRIEAEPYAIGPDLYERFSLSTAIDRLEELAGTGDRPVLGRFRMRL